MSAWVKTDIGEGVTDIRFTPKADIAERRHQVRFVPIKLMSAVVRVGQELFLVRDDLREWVRVQCSVLLLVRKTGSNGLVKQRDHMVEAGRAVIRRGRSRRIDHQRPASRIFGKRPRCICEVACQIELDAVGAVADQRYSLPPMR